MANHYPRTACRRFFQGVDESERFTEGPDALFAETTYASGGHPPGGFFVIKSGLIAVITGNEHEAILSVFGEGDFFGETGLFNTAPIASMRVVSRNKRPPVYQLKGETPEERRDSLLTIFEREPKIAFNVLYEMAFRLARTNRLLACFRAEDRVALELWHRFSHPENDQQPELRVTQEDLARSLGADVQTVRDSLHNFADRGLVLPAIEEETGKKRRGVVIIDPKKLESYIQGLVG